MSTLQAGRLAWSRWELEGPIEGLTLSPATQVSATLRAGERAQFLLPVWVESSTALPSAPQVRWNQAEPGQGKARFLGFDEALPAVAERLPPSLKLRALPHLESVQSPLSLSLFWLLLAAALATAGLWRIHRLAATLLSVVAAAWVLIQVRELAPSWPVRLVYEGAPGAPWMERHLGFQELKLDDPASGYSVRREPNQGRVALHASLQPGSAWVLSGPGLWIAERPSELELGYLSAASNDWGGLAELWHRSEQGWSYHPAWERGEPLAPAQAGPPAPGWLAAGLPQSGEVWLARLSSDPKVWIRQLGP